MPKRVREATLDRRRIKWASFSAFTAFSLTSVKEKIIKLAYARADRKIGVVLNKNDSAALSRLLFVSLDSKQGLSRLITANVPHSST